MITMKPIASWLLAAAMTAGLLAGCGPRKAQQQEPAAETPAETCFTVRPSFFGSFTVSGQTMIVSDFITLRISSGE